MTKPEDRLLHDGLRPDHESFKAFLEELDKETARGIVLIACATIENLLGKVIELFLVNHKAVEGLLEGPLAPLGTFSARILAAVSLGLISDDEYKDCESLRKIRNAFAHDVRISFRDERVKSLCKNLRFYGKTLMNQNIGEEGVFRVSAVAMMTGLINRMYDVTNLQLQTQSWRRGFEKPDVRSE